MKRFVRNQILELLSTIWEGVKQLKTLNKQSKQSILNDCYLAVKTIEQSLQNGFSQEVFAKYIKLLSNIKEYLAEINTGISQNVSVMKFTKKLKVELNLLNKTLSEEKEINLEVVFFPYKASMWDCLESIWFAARDDENCDVYVVPIPYYDRLPNGELGEMHYEGDLYPEYVPVVNWQVYDLEKRCPDIIYIHNPYDNNNFVTSVHPNFYSQHLRKFTDMLVYVPYFIVLSDVPEHFCITGGCRNAHKTIVQSKRVCNTYIRAFKKTFGNKFGKPEDKFVMIGSPKLDKVTHMNRASYAISKTWRQIIGDKKVVFYNTSIGPMLKDSDEYLNKLKDVLNLFCARRDVVLWWRPHPLAMSTLASMRPALVADYKKIIKKYQNDSYGIYDDTADLYQAMAWSDAYYGDAGSSLLALWLATGKPLLLQDVSCLSKNDKNAASLLPLTAFSSTDRTWKYFMENSSLPQISLQNMLDLLTMDRLQPSPVPKSSMWYELPEGGAGQAIHQYIKRLVMPT